MNHYFLKIIFCFLLLFSAFNLSAQDNYEIQIYGAPTIEKNKTMFELHSNYTFDGRKDTVNDVLPTNHVFHETLENTHGFTDYFEIGFYLFNSIGNNGRTAFVGSHIRPRICVPKKWNLPIGLSLSAEYGIQKRQFSEDDQTLEIRPIIDKEFKKLYLSFNPAFDKSLHGLNQKTGFEFSPAFKINYKVSKKISPGFEYFAGIGPLNNLFPTDQQQHQLFITLDVNFSDAWEFNCGYGMGFTPSTDKSIFKIILGRRI